MSSDNLNNLKKNIDSETKENLSKKIEQWKRKLLDLSRRNRLITFKDYKTRTLLIDSYNSTDFFKSFISGDPIYFYKFSEPEEEENEEDYEVNIEEIKKELSEKDQQNIWIPDYDNDSTEDRLYNIYLKTNESLREQGINTLFVAFGFLHYFDQDYSEEEMKAPLLLVPAKINKKKGAFKHKHNYELKFQGEDIKVNPALKQKFDQDFELKLPDFAEETTLAEWFDHARDSIKGKPNWNVDEKLCIGNFSFRKLQLYEDIDGAKEEIFQNPIMQVLGGASRDRLGNFEEVPKRENLDEAVKPSETFQVLDADSSQQVAIEAAKRGCSFVIQGPPGTGKSQTIVNIISELLAQNKKVLFVSQKTAALEVVKNRLDEVGLGKYCLELHSFKANKKAVLAQLQEELEKRLEVDSNVKEEDFFHKLTNLKEELNGFGEQLLQERGELKKSLYSVIGNLSKLDSLPDITYSVNKPLKITQEELSEKENALSKIENYEEEVKRYKSFPWKGINIGSITLSKETELKKQLEQLVESKERVESDLDKAKKIGFSLNTSDDLEKAYSVAKQIFNKPDNLEVTPDSFKENLTPLLNLLSELVEELEELKEIRSVLLGDYKGGFLEFQAEKLLEKFKKNAEGFSKVAKKNYWQDKLKVAKFAKNKKKLSKIAGRDQKIRKDLEKLIAYQKKKNKTQKVKDKLRDTYEIRGSELVEWKWLASFVELIKPKQDIIQSYSKLFNRKEGISDFIKLFEENYQEKFKPLLDEFLNKFEEGQRHKEDYFSWVDKLQQDFDSLRSWDQFTNSIDNLSSELKRYLQFFIEKSYPPQYLRELYRKAFFQSFLSKIEEDFNPKKGDYYKQRIKTFRSLDERQKRIARKRIKEQREDKKPNTDGFRSSIDSELGLLQREIKKESRHKPLRELFSKASNLVFSLKPCFMMSPLSVAQYIQLDKVDTFDTVIFDEASQVMPEDAVSSIIRADQAIIVGDSEQLPPTRFFHRSEDEGEIEEELEDLDSILDTTAGGKFNSKSLKWHYRSKDESLIAFSNRKFYNNTLITFPNNEIHSSDLGIEYIYVKDGIYDRGGSRKNRKEAQKVVELVKNHIKNYPDKSLGVVAFSQSQQRAIQEEIERFRRRNSGSKKTGEAFSEDEGEVGYENFFANKNILEEFFVKNLESVQGDERDVMIFSVGYGPDEAGKMTLHFGPINRSGGYKRLNVAITRAREKIYLVSSFEPESLDPSKTTNEGVKYLIQYMKYAKKGPEYLGKEVDVTNTANVDSGFEEAVYDALTDEGLDVATQVGVSGYRIDLAVKNPQKKGEFILGIECDGQAYHSTATARDRDRIRQNVLENVGWDIHRVWSQDWRHNKEKEIEKIREKIQQTLVEKEGLEFNSQNDSKTEDELIIKEHEENQDSSFSFEEYETASLLQRGEETSDFYGWDSFPRIKEDIIKIVEKESPIRIEIVFKRMAKAWGIPRLGSKIKRRILNALEEVTSENKIVKSGDTIWSKKKEKVVAFRKSNEEQRPNEFIPKEEVGGLIMVILENGFSIQKDDLKLEVAKQLGYTRRGKKIEKRLNKIVEYLKSVDYISEENGRIYPNKQFVD